MSRPFNPRGPWRYCMAVLALCLVLSTELLFNLGTMADWSMTQVLSGWLEQFADTTWLGMLALMAVAATDRQFQRDSRWRLVALGAAAAVATGAAYAALTVFHFPAGYYPPPTVLMGEALRAIVLAVLFTLVWSLNRRAARAAQRIRRLELDRAVLQRRTQEARLKVLEAQIEPHFLFNTLATVKCLYRAGAAEGDRMLSNLQHYLGAALPRIRDDAATLASECALVSAYLDILQIRMGPRLQFGVDVPAALAGHSFPPMMLATLVENAIKHGLAPSAAGGRIAISAAVHEGALVVSVADNGAGFQASSGSGVGLVNIRTRLRALYGERAALALRQNAPCGVVASISVPLQPAPPAPAGQAPASDTAGAPGRAPDEAHGLDSWRRRLRARLPQVLLVGAALGAMDALHILPIEMESPGWLHIALGAGMALCNAVMGTTVLVAVITAAEHAAAAPRRQVPLLATAVLLGALLAAALALPAAYWLHRLGVLHHIDSFYGLFIHMLWAFLATGALAAAGYTMEQRSRRTAMRLWTARRDCTEAKRMMIESRLNILKARIEPGVLVREIGRIQRLYRSARARGELQLERLIAYLQAALPHLHGGGATLGDELALAEAYLRLHADSWGERLDWRFDVHPALHALRFPPMTLLPLIDDAMQRARDADVPRLRLLVCLQAAGAGFRLTVEDNCATTAAATNLQDAMAIQAKSFCDFYGQRGSVSRETDGHATRVALTADIDTAGLQLGL